MTSPAKLPLREAQPLTPRMIERRFPSYEVSRLVAADRRTKDPVYGIHRWFARRPPTLVRALLLAAHAEESVDDETFWSMHESAGAWLKDVAVYDPFMGGGTSLVEAARMGAAVHGRDVDPIATEVVSSELHGRSPNFERHAVELIEGLRDEFERMYVSADSEWTPLHWFWLFEPTCPSCGDSSLMYKDLILARSLGKRGAVLRDDDISAFCPECHRVHGLSADRKTLFCCGKRRRLDAGTASFGKFTCPSCDLRSTHEELQTGSAKRVLIGVEETKPGSRRRIRSVADQDRQLIQSAAERAKGEPMSQFDLPLTKARRDRRPVSAGFTSSRSLYTERQWLLYTEAFSKLRTGSLEGRTRRDVTLMLTGSLSSNNVLCGYARDWGRLAPLFSVRGFALPTLMVELNPFHPRAGRGTLRSALTRMVRSSETTIRRASRSDGAKGKSTIELPVVPTWIDIVCASADDTTAQASIEANVCVTDPPYFDYIAYSELSEFFRVWLESPALAGTPLLPNEDDRVQSFAFGLGACLKVTLERLATNTPLVFTYHSADFDAWRAIGEAFDHAQMVVTAMWPVLADPHMGHHAKDGNCEWDVVVVARRQAETLPSEANQIVDDWTSEIEKHGFELTEADTHSFSHALAVVSSRWGTVRVSSP